MAIDARQWGTRICDELRSLGDSQRIPSPAGQLHFGGCCDPCTCVVIDCSSGRGGGSKDEGCLVVMLVAAAALAAVAFFASLAWTLGSVEQSNTYENWRSEGAHALSTPPQPSNGEIGPPGLHPDDKKIFEIGTELLTQMRNERALTSVGRGLVTLGAGFLTAACIAALISQSRFSAPLMAYQGAGAIVAGPMVLLGTQIYYSQSADRREGQYQELFGLISKFN